MSFVHLEIQDLFAILTLDRVEKHNALNADMILKLKECFDQVKRSDSIRALVIKAKGKNFCSGADLNWMKSFKDKSFEENQDSAKTLFQMFKTLEQVPVPVISYVQGACRGGALGILGLSDFVLCEKNATFGFAEVRLGLVPAVISPFVFKKMNSALARALMFTGENFDTDKALSSHLIQFAGTSEECEKELFRIKKNLAQAAPEALRGCKSLLNLIESPLKADFESALEEETTRVIAHHRSSLEGHEGLISFFDKRKPSWVKDIEKD